MSSAFRLSVLANLAQLLVIAALLGRGPVEPPAPLSSAPRPPRDQSAASPPPTEGAEHPRDDDESALGPELVGRLERAGLSRAVIVQALLADFNQRWDLHVLEVEKRYAPRAVPDREYIELGRMREASLERELKTALGEGGYRAWHKEQALRLVNGTGVPISAEEAEQAYRLQAEFDRKHADLQMAMEDGIADRADAVALQMQAREALDRDLESLFGKARLDAMRGYADPLANISRTYGDLAPSPEQARAVLASEETHRAREAALAERLKKEAPAVESISAELKKLDAQRDADLGGIFGADAYEGSKRQNDPVHKALRQFATAWELGSDKIEPVYAALSSFNRQRERMLGAAAMSEAAGHPVAWREINASLERERQTLEAGLRTLVGADLAVRLGRNGLWDAR